MRNLNFMVTIATVLHLVSCSTEKEDPNDSAKSPMVVFTGDMADTPVRDIRIMRFNEAGCYIDQFSPGVFVGTDKQAGELMLSLPPINAEGPVGYLALVNTGGNSKLHPENLTCGVTRRDEIVLVSDDDCTALGGWAASSDHTIIIPLYEAGVVITIKPWNFLEIIPEF